VTTPTTTAPPTASPAASPVADAALARHSAFGDTFAVLRSALRLLWRHWPVLIGLALAGFAARRALLMASVKASALSPTLAVLVFALVPASMLVAMLLMMRVVRSSLPDLVPNNKRDDRDAFFVHIASVFVPFLAVYSAYDYFAEDRQDFRYEVWFDETLNNPEIFSDPASVNTAERLPPGASLTMATIIGAALLVRLLFGVVTRRAKGNLAIGFSRGYLEATWVSLSALSFTGIGNDVYLWLIERRMWDWVANAAHTVASWFGPLSPAAHRVVDWFGEILGSVDSVFIIPIAWLTIGFVIYGHELVSPPRTAGETALLGRVPGPVRTILIPLRNGTDDRFGPMVRGFRLLKSAGLRSMLLFCLAFVVAQALPEWLWELERLIIGPRDLDAVWVPLSGSMSTVNECIGLMATICLVTAAVDHVLRVTPPPPPPVAVPPPAPSATEPSAADAQPEVAGELEFPAYLYGDGLDAGGREEKNRGGVLT